MHRIAEELGGHAGLAVGALSKMELVAALCRAGIAAGLWAVPEYEISGIRGSRRKIDVVWATRSARGSGDLWHPVAAFEVEGHDVDPNSVSKNADSLVAAANAGAVIRAMVLFQAGPDGQRWHRRSHEAPADRPEKQLRQGLVDLGSTHHVEVLMDESLCDRLPAWTSLAKHHLASASKKSLQG